jgi:serine/threonine protein kinase
MLRLLEHRPARRGAPCEAILALELCAGATLRETLIAASGDGDGDGAEGSAALALSSESDRLLAHIFRQILTALAYCHARNFCHRDVKLENVVLRHPSAEWPRRGAVPVLLDFGIAAELRAGERLTGVMGSPGALWPPRAVHASVYRVLCASMRQWHLSPQRLRLDMCHGGALTRQKHQHARRRPRLSALCDCLRCHPVPFGVLAPMLPAAQDTWRPR